MPRQASGQSALWSARDVRQRDDRRTTAEKSATRLERPTLVRMVPFVTFDLAPGQVLPAPLQELDLILAQPIRQGGRLIIPFQFVAKNVSAEAAEEIERVLEADCYGFTTRYHDRVTGRWEAEGSFDLATMGDPIVQMLPSLMDRIDLPWIHMAGGRRYLRMAPLTDLDAVPLQASVERVLREAADARRVILSYQDYSAYETLKSRLAPPEQARPASYF